jgi:hypothetical protein
MAKKKTTAKATNVVSLGTTTLAHDTNKTRLAAVYGVSARTIGRWLVAGWVPGNSPPAPNERPKIPESNQRVPTGADPAGSHATAGIGSIVNARYVFALALAAVCGTMNARYHWSLGTTIMTSASLAVTGFVLDGLTVVLPKHALELWRERNRVRAFLVWGLWASVFVPLTALGTAGFTSQNIGDAVTARASILSQASEAADQRIKNIEIVQRSADTATESRKAECEKRGPRCREYEATEKKALEALAAVNALPIEARPAISAADPAAHMLDELLHRFGVTERRVQYLRNILMTIALTTAGLLL